MLVDDRLDAVRLCPHSGYVVLKEMLARTVMTLAYAGLRSSRRALYSGGKQLGGCTVLQQYVWPTAQSHLHEVSTTLQKIETLAVLALSVNSAISQPVSAWRMPSKCSAEWRIEERAAAMQRQARVLQLQQPRT